MKVLVRITAQYHENYNLDGGTPHWKAKGGQEFELEANDDMFLYDKANCIKSIEKLLAEQSDSHNKYTYLDHELIFKTAIKLSTDKFEKNVMRMQES